MISCHTHSEYSPLDGFAKVEEIADRIEKVGLGGAFISDHGTVAGVPKFRKTLLERGLFAGAGIEAYQARTSREIQTGFKRGEDEFHLILLASTPEGYKNLFRISDEASRTGFYWNPRVDWELLEKHNEGLIATSACMGSLVNQGIMEGNTEYLNRMLNIFGDRYYIELHTYDAEIQRELNAELVSIAQTRGVPVLYSTDAHYARPNQYMLHEAWLAIQYGTNLWAEKGRKGEDGKYVPYYEPDHSRYHPQSLYILSQQEVRVALKYLPESVVEEAMANSDLLASQCEFQVEKQGLHLPRVKGEAKKLLLDLMDAGITERYGDDPSEEVLQRAEREFLALTDKGLEDYFLITHDYIDHALKNGKFVSSRGSVGGSLLAYLLGITHIDPLEYNLPFERFWNPGREEANTLPDIDIDFEQSARQFMIDYAIRKYGERRVLPIGNHIFLWPKSAIDKAGMVLYEKPPYGLMTKVKAIIEKTDDAGHMKPWDEMMEEVGEELQEYIDAEPDLFLLAEKISNRLSTYGQHAAAIVISDVDLQEYIPARSVKGEVAGTRDLVTQFEMKMVEELGFPKFDFLGLRNLDTLVRAAILSGEFGEDSPETRKAIVRFYRNEYSDKDIPESGWELVDKGHTLGIFQIEQGGQARSIGKRMKPRSIADLAALVALNKPGPLRSGQTDLYLERRNGQTELDFPHPILEEILRPTQGIFLYQEDVMAFFVQIGYSLAEADDLRKTISKKIVQKMKDEKERYLKRAGDYMEPQKAEELWNLISDFAMYGFNKAHAWLTGKMTSWTIYAKDRWPLAFVMASIETNPKKTADWLNEARRMGIVVQQPDINKSQANITSVEDVVYYGLRDVKGLGPGTAQWVVDNAPYVSVEDFMERAIEGKIVDRGHIKCLFESGALDSFGYRRAKCADCEGRGRIKSDPEKRRYDLTCPDCDGLGWAKRELPSDAERMAYEEAYFGMVLTDFAGPLIEQYAGRLETLDPLTAADVEDKTTVKVPGIIRQIKETKTSATSFTPNAAMAHVTIEWEGEQVRFAAFPDTWAKFKFALKPHAVGEFTLETSKKGPKLKGCYRYV